MALEWPTCDYNDKCDVLIDCLDILEPVCMWNGTHVRTFRNRCFVTTHNCNIQNGEAVHKVFSHKNNKGL